KFLFDGIEGPYPHLIDQKMRELPGLEWFDLFTKFVKTHDIGKAPASWFPLRGVNHGDRETAIAAE
ncbi:MAG: hypothetical protein L6Q76_31005, partial [Polyangiaceae bacterium]|nr:hypothetical protein [Polyangiaceae bacterium]